MANCILCIEAKSMNSRQGSVLLTEVGLPFKQFNSIYVEDGTLIEIIAIPTHGYQFKMWNDGDTNNRRTIVTTEDIQYIAFFDKQTNK